MKNKDVHFARAVGPNQEQAQRGAESAPLTAHQGAHRSAGGKAAAQPRVPLPSICALLPSHICLRAARGSCAADGRVEGGRRQPHPTPARAPRVNFKRSSASIVRSQGGVNLRVPPFKQNQKIKQKSKFWPFQGAHVTRTIKNQFAAKIPFRREVRCAATRAVSVD